MKLEGHKDSDPCVTCGAKAWEAVGSAFQQFEMHDGGVMWVRVDIMRCMTCDVSYVEGGEDVRGPESGTMP